MKAVIWHLAHSNVCMFASVFLTETKIHKCVHWICCNKYVLFYYFSYEIALVLCNKNKRNLECRECL